MIQHDASTTNCQSQCGQNLRTRLLLGLVAGDPFSVRPAMPDENLLVTAEEWRWKLEWPEDSPGRRKLLGVFDNVSSGLPSTRKVPMEEGEAPTSL